MSNVDWVATRNEIIELALRKCNAFADTETLSGKKLENGIRNLNMITKRLQNHNLLLWNYVENAVISTVAGTQTYAITNDDIVGIERAWIRTGTGTTAVDTFLDVYPFAKLWSDELKAAQGQPTMVALNYDFTTPRVYCYPIPDAVYSLYIVKVQKLRDWDNSSDSTLFPQWWVEALVWQLADALAPDYGVDVQRQAVLKQRATEALAQARVDNFTRTDTVFEPY